MDKEQAKNRDRLQKEVHQRLPEWCQIILGLENKYKEEKKKG